MKTPFSRSARLLLLLGILASCLPIPAAPPPRMPMPIVEADTANHRWLQKPVLESRLLDDMEQTNAWSHAGVGQMSFAADRAKDGRQSVRIVSPTKTDKPNPVVGRPFGECTARRTFPGADWSGFNRLSFWVYPHLPGFKVISMLVKQQLQWHVGRNPFAQSLMFGEGHDYAPQYTALSGDMVGSLPVGIQTRKNADLPYWPAANCYNYKEVWVHPSSRWLGIMADLLGDKPEGTRQRSAVQLSGLALEPQAGGRATFRAEIAGKGRHPVALRAGNLAIETEPVQSVSLSRNTLQVTVTWPVRVLNPNEPVVAVVIPDGDPGRSRDYVSRQPVGPGGRPVP